MTATTDDRPTVELPPRPPLVEFDRDAARQWLTVEDEHGRPRYYAWLTGPLTEDLSGMELALGRLDGLVGDAANEQEMFGPYDPLLVVEGEGFVVTVDVQPDVLGAGVLRLASCWGPIGDLSLTEHVTEDGIVPVPPLDQVLDVLEHTADEVNKAIVRAWEGLAAMLGGPRTAAGRAALRLCAAEIEVSDNHGCGQDGTATLGDYLADIRTAIERCVGAER